MFICIVQPAYLGPIIGRSGFQSRSNKIWSIVSCLTSQKSNWIMLFHCHMWLTLLFSATNNNKPWKGLWNFNIFKAGRSKSYTLNLPRYTSNNLEPLLGQPEIHTYMWHHQLLKFSWTELNQINIATKREIGSVGLHDPTCAMQQKLKSQNFSHPCPSK